MTQPRQQVPNVQFSEPGTVVGPVGKEVVPVTPAAIPPEHKLLSAAQSAAVAEHQAKAAATTTTPASTLPKTLTPPKTTYVAPRPAYVYHHPKAPASYGKPPTKPIVTDALQFAAQADKIRREEQARLRNVIIKNAHEWTGDPDKGALQHVLDWMAD